MLILSVLLTLFGLLMLIKPVIIWAISESWKSNYAIEPSDLYIVSARFGEIEVSS